MIGLKRKMGEKTRNVRGRKGVGEEIVQKESIQKYMY